MQLVEKAEDAISRCHVILIDSPNIYNITLQPNSLYRILAVLRDEDRSHSCLEFDIVYL